MLISILFYVFLGVYMDRFIFNVDDCFMLVDIWMMYVAFDDERTIWLRFICATQELRRKFMR